MKIPKPLVKSPIKVVNVPLAKVNTANVKDEPTYTPSTQLPLDYAYRFGTVIGLHLGHSSHIVKKVEVRLYKDGVTSEKNGILVQHKTQSKAIILLESPMNLSDFAGRESVIKDSKTGQTLTFETLTMFSSDLDYCISMMAFEDTRRSFRYQWIYSTDQVQWY